MRHLIHSDLDYPVRVYHLRLHQHIWSLFQKFDWLSLYHHWHIRCYCFDFFQQRLRHHRHHRNA
jgi:hypothetical protein